MKLKNLTEVAQKAREDFQSRTIKEDMLIKLYEKYNPIPNLGSFVHKSKEIFPKLNCGLASLYLKEKLEEGEIVRGNYKGENHTFLLIRGNIVVDITSDQYGGPEVYVGPLRKPWKVPTL